MWTLPSTNFIIYNIRVQHQHSGGDPKSILYTHRLSEHELQIKVILPSVTFHWADRSCQICCWEAQRCLPVESRERHSNDAPFGSEHYKHNYWLHVEALHGSQRVHFIMHGLNHSIVITSMCQTCMQAPDWVLLQCSPHLTQATYITPWCHLPMHESSNKKR